MPIHNMDAHRFVKAIEARIAAGGMREHEACIPAEMAHRLEIDAVLAQQDARYGEYYDVQAAAVKQGVLAMMLYFSVDP